MSRTSAPEPEDPEGLTLRLGAGGQLPRWFWRAVLAVLAVVAGYQFGRGVVSKLSDLLVMLGVALFLSFAVEPAVNFLADRGWRRSTATLACFLALLIGGGGFVALMGGLVIGQATDLAEKLPVYLQDATAWVNETFGTAITTENIVAQISGYQDNLSGLASDVGGRVLSVTGTLVGLLFQVFTVALFSYYMTSQGPKLRRNVCSVLPERNQRTVLLLWELAIAKTGGWIYSRLLLAAVSSAAAWVVFSLVGLPSPLALALWVGLISQFIPAIGTYLAGAVPLLIALLNRPVSALWVLVFIVVYQQIENYLLSPRITAQTMDLHPAVAFGSAIAGGALMGPIGAIMALPFAGVAQAFVSTVLERHEVIDSHLTELEDIRRADGDRGVRRALRSVLRDQARGAATVGDDPGDDESEAVGRV